MAQIMDKSHLDALMDAFQHSDVIVSTGRSIIQTSSRSSSPLSVVSDSPWPPLLTRSRSCSYSEGRRPSIAEALQSGTQFIVPPSELGLARDCPGLPPAVLETFGLSPTPPPSAATKVSFALGNNRSGSRYRLGRRSDADRCKPDDIKSSDISTEPPLEDVVGPEDASMAETPSLVDLKPLPWQRRLRRTVSQFLLSSGEPETEDGKQLRRRTSSFFRILPHSLKPEDFAFDNVTHPVENDSIEERGRSIHKSTKLSTRTRGRTKSFFRGRPKSKSFSTSDPFMAPVEYHTPPLPSPTSSHSSSSNDSETDASSDTLYSSLFGIISDDNLAELDEATAEGVKTQSLIFNDWTYYEDDGEPIVVA